VDINIKVSKHVSFRSIQVEYFLTRLQNLRTLGDNSQNNLRYSAGLEFMFGVEEPTPPPTQPLKTCPDGSKVPPDAACPKLNVKLSVAATPQELCQGETAQVNAFLTGADGNPLNFQWSVNGQPISTGHSLAFSRRARQVARNFGAMSEGQLHGQILGQVPRIAHGAVPILRWPWLASGGRLIPPAIIGQRPE
jgi:hypothetical protein